MVLDRLSFFGVRVIREVCFRSPIGGRQLEFALVREKLDPSNYRTSLESFSDRGVATTPGLR
jgi:hypothetical protein